MQDGSSKHISPKHYGVGENNSVDSSSGKKLSGLDKGKQQEKSFTFSLNFFQKNYGIRKTTEALQTQKIPQEDLSFSVQSFDSEKQEKRKNIYAIESFQDQEEKEQLVTTQSNNNLFQQIFLSKSGKVEESPKQPEVKNQTVFTKNKQPINPVTPPAVKPKEQIQQEFVAKITDFDIGKKLGSGKFGQVYLAKHKAGGFVCALKKIQKSKIDSKLAVQLLREIKIQMFLNHPNIVKMYGFFSDSQFIYLAMELCISGQLYSYLKKRRRVPEDMTRNIVSQVSRALDYMHENEIIHRDLKPQNIIYQCGLVKICDFGWSISTNTMRGTFCGTPLYVSPELLKRKNYNNKIDVWSVGILTYELLFGKVPFEIQTEQDFIKIVEDEIKFSKITKVSDQGKDFILNCLQKDPRDRYTVPQLLQHPFLTKMQNVSMLDMF